VIAAQFNHPSTGDSATALTPPPGLTSAPSPFPAATPTPPTKTSPTTAATWNSAPPIPTKTCGPITWTWAGRFRPPPTRITTRPPGALPPANIPSSSARSARRSPRATCCRASPIT
jgi:hypothetical protein